MSRDPSGNRAPSPIDRYGFAICHGGWMAGYWERAQRAALGYVPAAAPKLEAVEEGSRVLPVRGTGRKLPRF